MWEQIQSNKRKTIVLVLAMALLLFGLGFIIGEAYIGAGEVGLLIAFVIWAIMTLVAYFKGDNILLAVSGAKKIEKDDHPELFNVVEEMTIASGLGKMPDVYVINDTAMNAFAVGRKPETAAVAVTAGLLGHLNRDELQGVVAHEIAHINNRDVLLMTMVGVMLGAIVMISETYLRSMFYGMGSRRRYSSSSNSKKGGGQGIAMVIALVAAILAPILAQLIYFAVSRKREYLADASGVVMTRYPEGLASALEQLGGSSTPVQRANKATASMYIVNPFAKVSLSALSSTHPPIADRVSILRSIGGTVNYGAYQEAWGAAGKMPKSALQDLKAGGAVREADPRSEKKSARRQVRETGDLLRKINQFAFLPCVCGLKLKLPPDFKHDKVDCPKCKRTLEIPVAQLAAISAIADKIPGDTEVALNATPVGKNEPPLEIRHTPGEWMSFKCSCGAGKTLSPGFAAKRMKCSKCGRKIQVV